MTHSEERIWRYYALAHRITSLYWFNLSLKSLLKFPDLIEPITRIGREINVSFEWPVPSHLDAARTLLGVDADAVTPTEHERQGGRVSLRTRGGAVNVFVLSFDRTSREQLEARRRELAALEDLLQPRLFPPAKGLAELKDAP